MARRSGLQAICPLNTPLKWAQVPFLQCVITLSSISTTRDRHPIIHYTVATLRMLLMYSLSLSYVTVIETNPSWTVVQSSHQADLSKVNALPGCKCLRTSQRMGQQRYIRGPPQTKTALRMSVKIHPNRNLSKFNFWSGAMQHLNTLCL